MAKTLTGVVVADKANKTIVIEIHSRKTHPIYKKQFSVTKKVMAHDEKNSAKLGDTVTIVETRPLSRNKQFILKDILGHASLSSEDKAIITDEEGTQE